MNLNPDNFYYNVGLTDIKSWNTFESKLQRKFGVLYENFINIIERRSSGENIDPYSIKNSNLEFSLALTSQYYGNYYKKLFKLLANYNLNKPKKILDLGCESGILSCYLAVLFPESQIHGIDIISENINIAKKIADKFAIRNVVFSKSNVLDIIENNYDLILSSMFFHEALNMETVGALIFPEADVLNVEEALSNYVPKNSNIIKNLTNKLSENGILLSIDRVPSASHLAFWHKELQSGGLILDTYKSTRISAILTDPTFKEESFPVSFLTKGNNLKLTYTQSLLLSTNLQFSEIFFDTYLQDVAEIIYRSLSINKTYFKGSNTYTKGVRIIEVSTTDTTVLTYIYTSLGYRELRFSKLTDLFTIIELSKKELYSHISPSILNNVSE